MKIVAAAAALVVLTLSLAVSSASAEHVVVLVGETAFEKAIKVRCPPKCNPAQNIASIASQYNQIINTCDPRRECH